MAITGIRLVGLRQREVLEWAATMEVSGDGPPASFAGQQIVEAFGRPRIWGRMMQNSDLNPEFYAEHQGNARRAMEFVSAGRPGRFTIDSRGQFIDYHGGHGFSPVHILEWFTLAALRRGIGWYFEQSYRSGERTVARFRVIRICRPSGIEVLKQPM